MWAQTVAMDTCALHGCFFLVALMLHDVLLLKATQFIEQGRKERFSET